MRRFWAAWKVALRIIALTFRAELEYRVEFLTNILFGIAWQVSIIVFASVLLERFQHMAGWASRAVLLIAAMRMFSHGLFVLFFDRQYQLADFVQQGRMDALL